MEAYSRQSSVVRGIIGKAVEVFLCSMGSRANDEMRKTVEASAFPTAKRDHVGPQNST